MPSGHSTRLSAVLCWALLAVNLALCASDLLTWRWLSAGYALGVVWLLPAVGTRRRLSFALNLLLLASLLASSRGRWRAGVVSPYKALRERRRRGEAVPAPVAIDVTGGAAEGR